ncbi:Acetyltransferase YpeA [Helicobacter fennelliae]|uniref:Predicted amino-acid acetyltransferase complementing ArgA function in Arginine Biosynthesis pathway n=3 Tax=Helicobacter TaxID=209 RepID=T1DW41_9HELI|nr:predicted amino-acid acetyltransferase complementing ArgA function in Arginine Biosynthesis pathway [Helicobacter fennelliae MRY12-0050]SQB99058.1 Acetyltransferase YpeA [Helicobacter fennelliae]STP08335.1 Acetyltransferase YpeA [Helicobacter fennelliae]
MTKPNIHIRAMRSDDYDKVQDLWQHIEGFYIRSVDDSREGIERFLARNPNMSVVALTDEGDKNDEKIIGSVLCGHDGRYGSLYHVCVHEDFRKNGIGRAMVEFALNALKRESISTISLIAFSTNKEGNAFWKGLGWDIRQNVNRYELSQNPANISTKITPNKSNFK